MSSVLPASATPGSAKKDAQVIALISLGHSASHFFQLLLPPLFPILKVEFGTSYAVLGAMTAVFYTISGLMQTVSGFLVDRLGARRILLGGLTLIACAALLAAAAPRIEWLFAAAALGGLGNSVFHPADLSLLNARVDPRRLGHAFSMHGLGGSLGWAAAPLFAIGLAHAFGWRWAVAVAGILGLLLSGFVATRQVLKPPCKPAREQKTAPAMSWRANLALLTSVPVFAAFGYFVLYSVALIGLQAFSTTVATQMFGVSLLAANSALTAFLLGSGVGVISGGLIASRTSQHGRVAAIATFAGAVVALMLAGGMGNAANLMPLMALLGFTLGCIGPSRDILIRSIAPANARGKVYGFVYSGADAGGLFGPLAFGVAIDHAVPAWVYGGSALCLLLAIGTLRRFGSPS